MWCDSCDRVCRLVSRDPSGYKVAQACWLHLVPFLLVTFKWVKVSRK